MCITCTIVYPESRFTLYTFGGNKQASDISANWPATALVVMCLPTDYNDLIIHASEVHVSAFKR